MAADISRTDGTRFMLIVINMFRLALTAGTIRVVLNRGRYRYRGRKAVWSPIPIPIPTPTPMLVPMGARLIWIGTKF
jgi:hypothetical protein